MDTVPSHIGIPGNDLADLAAKQASTLFPLPCIGIPPLDFKQQVKSCLAQQWTSSWEQIPLTNKLRSITRSPGCDYWSCLPHRRDQVTICRLRLGHTLLTHGFLLQKTPAPICVACNVPLSVKHILLECGAYASYRENVDLPSSLPEIFSISVTSKLLAFLELIGLRGKL